VEPAADLLKISKLPIFYLPTGDSTKSPEDQEREEREEEEDNDDEQRNRMKKTRWRKWWSVGGISSVCNVDLLSSRRLKLHRQCLVNPKDCRTQITT
jgi:hypothetical protein